MGKFPSVTDVVTKIKNLLEGEFRNISLEGEVSNLSSSASGHWYFTLSDKNSSLSVALFKADAFRNPMIKGLQNGDQIMCSGSVGVYSKRGTFQLIAKRISPAGKGDLKQEFEKLKKKLAAEGLFDLENKVKIPVLPKRIGVVTAKKSAAIQDFLKIMNRRCHWHDIVISDALVQGELAPASIIKALQKLIKHHIEAKDSHKLDVIVLTRGGGSMEDLWAFNDEALAWEIHNCPIPIISAVGHEVDFSISDMVADFRAETPSAAAELLSNRQMELLGTLSNSQKFLSRHMNQSIIEANSNLISMHPKKLIEIFYTRLNSYQKRLIPLNLANQGAKVLKLYEKSMYLDELNNNALSSITTSIANKKNRVNNANEMLRVLNPENILERGYTLVKTDKGSIVSSFKAFEKLDDDQKMKLKFFDGIGSIRKANE